MTKTIEVERINELVRCGVHDLGENRVQEAESKRPALTEAAQGVPLVHHLIGSLQTNKAKRAVELFNVVQSVDRPKLAETLNRLAGEEGKIQRCLVEVKISSEPTKSGVPLSEAADFLKNFKTYAHLTLDGLMTIGELDVPETQTRDGFRTMKRLFDDHRALFGPKPVLSMGMSDDFQCAIEEGSTMVRIGRALFGERKPHG